MLYFAYTPSGCGRSSRNRRRIVEEEVVLPYQQRWILARVFHLVASSENVAAFCKGQGLADHELSQFSVFYVEGGAFDEDWVACDVGELDV